ncbi:MAG: relaxase MobL [Clostridiales bacterium]|nr:relaxase MobL [Clostridiales bacterium]
MSTVIYKLRVIGPRTRDAPQRNKAHMEYIGRRKGVVLNEGLKHGLFGVVDGRKAEEISSISELSRYIESKTRDGTITYRAVASLAEDDAMRLGYNDPVKWRELVRARMPDMAEKIGIPIHNLEYVAAFHRDKGHPHMHIQFWDTEQTIKKDAFVRPKVSADIRAGLVKYVFGEEMSELQELKNEARKAALDNIGGFFGNFVETLADMTPGEHAAAIERLKLDGDLADGRLIYSRFNTADTRAILSELLELSEIVPKTGRLYFKLMPSDVKDAIREFITIVLERNADCDREFKRYVQAAMDLSKFYTDKPEVHEKAARAAYDDMTARLGNVVLRTVKRLNQLERDQSYRRDMIEGLVTELFSVLARSADSGERTVAYRAGELSKQARKEQAMQLENTGSCDWGR